MFGVTNHLLRAENFPLPNFLKKSVPNSWTRNGSWISKDSKSESFAKKQQSFLSPRLEPGTVEVNSSTVLLNKAVTRPAQI